VKRPLLRRLVLALLGLIGLALAVVAVLLLNADRLARRALVATLERQTGVGVRLDVVELGLRNQTFRLQNLVISNPPGFGSEPLLALPELFLAYDANAAASNVVRFREVRLDLSELNLVVDRAGRTNLMELASQTGPARTNPTNLLAGFEFQGIDRLSLTLGRIAFTDLRDPRQNKRFNLGVTNRTFLNVNSPAQLLPLAVEIAFKGGLDLGLPAADSATDPRPAQK
jgi:uncharacterized protein involved in outer membrane biogenesis